MSENIKFDVEHMNLHYGDFHALKDINMKIRANEITALIGPSGCGKSTFLKSLNRMQDFVEGVKIDGSIRMDGRDIFKDMDGIELRYKVGMVFQQPNPFPKSVYDNVAYGPRIFGVKKKAELDEIVERSLRQAAIWDELKDRLKKSALGLSGGQQQRLCIARIGCRARSHSHGRADLCTGPNFHVQDRRPCAGVKERLYYSHCHP